MSSTDLYYKSSKSKSPSKSPSKSSKALNTSIIDRNRAQLNNTCKTLRLKGVTSTWRTFKRGIGWCPKKISETTSAFNDAIRINEILCIYNTEDNTRFIDTIYIPIINIIKLDIYTDRNKSTINITNLNYYEEIIKGERLKIITSTFSFNRESHRTEILEYISKVMNIIKTLKKASDSKKRINRELSVPSELSREAMKVIEEIHAGIRQETINRFIKFPPKAASSKPSSSRYKGGNMTRRKKRSN